jgi:2-oxoglutarate/2-oxoacid ferredoxin oxidoreductase subunit alpha
MKTNINFMVGGEAGQGVQSVGLILSKMFTRGGYHIVADQDYEFKIRDGHSFCRVRVNESPVEAISETVHPLIALNAESIAIHQKEVVADGLILVDSNIGGQSAGAEKLDSLSIAGLLNEFA